MALPTSWRGSSRPGQIRREQRTWANEPTTSLTGRRTATWYVGSISRRTRKLRSSRVTKEEPSYPPTKPFVSGTSKRPPFDRRATPSAEGVPESHRAGHSDEERASVPGSVGGWSPHYSCSVRG